MSQIQDNPKIAIVIINWNGYEDTSECLISLQKITYNNYKIILVDNGSRGRGLFIIKEKLL